MAPADIARLTALTLTGRVTTIEEVANAVAFLSCDAPNTTGQTMQLSGGTVRT